ncbi:hypothetical protein FNW02_37025 [Komarekiella sp. 'clone 1']|uniref:Uncharacterized protein n=1 Tax=Komarekiella delphini-convector SJRDD-AB1 TaxID=2593771 RepID=A0AA40VVQ7_9NOST|nr:hypothetical protein [Komarekiella delphini-convector]MBD6621155.1 hypothetical protein [Komarekiella delphini-convector SJRDD-AB1]
MLTTVMMLLDNQYFRHAIVVIGKIAIVRLTGLKAVAIQCEGIVIQTSLSQDYDWDINYFMEVLFGD